MLTETPPEAAIPAVPPFLLRGVARGIDIGVQLAIMEAAFHCSRYLPEGGLVQIGEGALFYVDLGVGLGALLLYTSLAEWLGGATLGKFLCGLRVVRADGSGAIGLREALIRGAAFFIDGLLLGLIAYSAVMRSTRGQRLGDQWAGTVVVWRGDAPGINGLVGWPIGIVAALGMVVGSYLFAS